MKNWQREHHHHHQRLTALLVQYAHLDLEQRLAALERDVTALADTIQQPADAARVLDRIADKLRGHR